VARSRAAREVVTAGTTDWSAAVAVGGRCTLTSRSLVHCGHWGAPPSAASTTAMRRTA